MDEAICDQLNYWSHLEIWYKHSKRSRSIKNLSPRSTNEKLLKYSFNPRGKPPQSINVPTTAVNNNLLASLIQMKHILGLGACTLCYLGPESFPASGCHPPTMSPPTSKSAHPPNAATWPLTSVTTNATPNNHPVVKEVQRKSSSAVACPKSGKGQTGARPDRQTARAKPDTAGWGHSDKGTHRQPTEGQISCLVSNHVLVYSQHASQILGVHLAPDENVSKQMEVLKTNAEDMVISLWSPKVTPQNIKTFHRTIYAPSRMQCILPALVVADEVDFAPVQMNVLALIFQKLEYSSKIATAIWLRPMQPRGLDLMDLHTELRTTEADPEKLMQAIDSQILTGI